MSAGLKHLSEQGEHNQQGQQQNTTVKDQPQANELNNSLSSKSGTSKELNHNHEEDEETEEDEDEEEGDDDDDNKSDEMMSQISSTNSSIRRLNDTNAKLINSSSKQNKN